MPLPQRPTGQRLYWWCGIMVCIAAVLFFVWLIVGKKVKDKSDIPGWIGGYCAILATVLSVFQILEHLSYFADPECQTKTVRILFMVPLYAMTSWLSILLPTASEYLDLVRDAYEAYALYNFFALMMAQMGGVDNLYRELMAEERPPVEHMFPVNHCAEPMRVTPVFVRRCRLSLVQFMVIKPLLSFTTIVLTAMNLMGDELFNLSKGLFWTVLIYNVSITIALIALWYFYFGTKSFLEGKNALSKFWCIKAVVFLSYWQGLGIQLLAAADALPRFDYWTAEDAPRGLQDLLICIEMMFIAFAHKFCFPSTEYTERDDADRELQPIASSEVAPHLLPARRSKAANLRLTLQHEDIRKDMRDTLFNR